jgi:hypothetical protein
MANGALSRRFLSTAFTSHNILLYLHPSILKRVLDNTILPNDTGS